MSETDSDLDFESADEDAEFASNINTNTKTEQCTEKSNESKENVVVTDETHSKVIKKPDDEPEKSKESCKKATNEPENKVAGVTNSEVIKKPDDEPEKSKNNSKQYRDEPENVMGVTDSEVKKNPEDEPEKSNACQSVFTNEISDKNVLVEGNEKVTNKIPNTSTENIDSNKSASQVSNEDNKSECRQPEVKTDPDDVEPEFQPEKPRVLLRIEKKKLQKSQLSKETSVETKEKASDLVNILREAPPEPQFLPWGFSSWGTSLLSTAASSVSTFSNQVSQGIGTVLETVESSLGAPAPEDLATALSQRKREMSYDLSEKDESENDPKPSLLPDVSSWSKVLENTGSKVLFGGLDTLELIGKKTMDMLTEGDPGLRKKRAVFSDKVNIAELLREARAKAEEQDRKDVLKEDSIHYSQIFDDKQGLVHLEALEMLSNQSQVKLQRLLMRHSKNVEVKKKLEEIKLICENMPSVDDISDCEKFEDFETVFKKHALGLSLYFNMENIIKVQRRINDDIAKYESASDDDEREAKEIFRAAICSLAEFSAKCIEVFHKISELLIVQTSLYPEIENCVTNLTGLTTVMCIEVNNVSTRYHKCLDATTKYNENKESSGDLDVTALATNLYVEAANSNKYIQDSFLMLIPVLQVCLLESLN